MQVSVNAQYHMLRGVGTSLTCVAPPLESEARESERGRERERERDIEREREK